MKKGFTLVELSIVLVIIGLLIGGVLVAQSLIESAKVNRLVRELEQIQISYDLFQDKYRCVAGDCTKSLGTTIGNGNRILDCNHERGNFWQHLNNGGFLTHQLVSGTYTSCTTTSITRIGQNIFPSEYADNAGYLATNLRIRGPERRNGVLLGKHDSSVQATRTNNVGLQLLEPLFVQSMDTKIDDAYPFTGDIQAGRGNDSPTSTGCVSASSYTNLTDPGNAVYQLDNAGEHCVMAYFLEK